MSASLIRSRAMVTHAIDPLLLPLPQQRRAPSRQGPTVRIALPPQASLLSTNGRSSSVRCVAVSSAGCRRRMLAEEVIPDLVHRQPEHSNIEKAAELVLRVRKLAERVGLDLPDSLAGYRELVSDLFQGMIAPHADAEAHAHDALLARR